jgi:hypothetical protein
VAPLASAYLINDSATKTITTKRIIIFIQTGFCLDDTAVASGTLAQQNSSLGFKNDPQALCTILRHFTLCLLPFNVMQLLSECFLQFVCTNNVFHIIDPFFCASEVQHLKLKLKEKVPELMGFR